MRKGEKRMPQLLESTVAQASPLSQAESGLENARVFAVLKFRELQAAQASHVEAKIAVSRAKEALLAEAKSLVERGQ